MSTRCEKMHEVLSAYADGHETPEETVAARAHLESCGACRAMLADWQRIEDALERKMEGPVPTEAMIAARAATPIRRSLVRAGMAAAVAAIAIAAVVVADFGGAPGVIEPAGSAAAAPAGPPEASQDPAPVAEPSPTKTPSERPAPSSSPVPPERSPSKDMPTVTRGTDGSLVLVLKIERAYARAGETLRAGIVLRNVTERAITFSSPEESPMDLVIRDPNGDEVWRRSTAEGWPRAMRDRTLAPGEQLAERFTFVAPRAGVYTVTAQCLCMPPGFDPDDPRAPEKGSGSTKPFETEPLKFASARARS